MLNFCQKSSRLRQMSKKRYQQAKTDALEQACVSPQIHASGLMPFMKRLGEPYGVYDKKPSGAMNVFIVE